MNSEAAGLGKIWQPLQIGVTTVKNRIMIASHGQAYGEDHQPSERMIAYFQERALGGASLLGVEATSATRSLGGAQPGGAASRWRLTAWEPRTIPAFARLAEAVHDHDARLFVQLSTGGVNDMGRAWTDDWHPVRGPSRVPSPIMNETPAPLEAEDIKELTCDYAKSAENLRRAGVDGVEIHAAHGYLAMQFLSPAFNKRTDGYGGSVKNRCRFSIEVGDAIRNRVGDALTLGMRLSFDEYIGAAGVTPDLAEECLEVFADSGLFDYFSISCGSWYSLHRTIPPMGTEPEAFLAPYGKRAKRVVGSRAKIFLAGRILSLEAAERVLTEGAADMAAMVRAHIAEPHLVAKTLAGRSGEIVRCAGTNECLAAPAKGRQVTCALNPAAGRERAWGEGTLRLATDVKRVTVVGGGPAGMRVAALAARRGHEVELIERSGRLGGHLDLLRRLPTRGDWQVAIGNLGAALEAAGVEPRLGEEATVETLLASGPDAVVCATGSSWDCTGFSAGRPDRERMPGADEGHVLDVDTAARAALEDPASLGDKVIILDDTGGYLPLGLAEMLGQAGAGVEVLSRFATIGDQAAATGDLAWMLPRLTATGVRLSPNHFIESVDGRRVEVYETLGGRTRLVDDVSTVVLSMLRSPVDGLFHDLRKNGRFEVHRIGDAVAPRSAAEAIYEGERLGRAL